LSSMFGVLTALPDSMIPHNWLGLLTITCVSLQCTSMRALCTETHELSVLLQHDLLGCVAGPFIHVGDHSGGYRKTQDRGEDTYGCSCQLHGNVAFAIVVVLHVCALLLRTLLLPCPITWLAFSGWTANAALR